MFFIRNTKPNDYFWSDSHDNMVPDIIQGTIFESREEADARYVDIIRRLNTDRDFRKRVAQSGSGSSSCLEVCPCISVYDIVMKSIDLERLKRKY